MFRLNYTDDFDNRYTGCGQCTARLVASIQAWAAFSFLSCATSLAVIIAVTHTITCSLPVRVPGRATAIYLKQLDHMGSTNGLKYWWDRSQGHAALHYGFLT